MRDWHDFQDALPAVMDELAALPPMPDSRYIEEALDRYFMQASLHRVDEHFTMAALASGAVGGTTKDIGRFLAKALEVRQEQEP